MFVWLIQKIGVAAIGLGTYGAHVFKPKNPTYKEVVFVLNFLVFGPKFVALNLICFDDDVCF